MASEALRSSMLLSPEQARNRMSRSVTTPMRRLDESTTGTELAELPAMASAISLMLLSGLTVGLAPDMTSPTDRGPLGGRWDRSRSWSGQSGIAGPATRALFTGLTRVWVLSERPAASSSTFRGRPAVPTSDTTRRLSRFFNVFLSGCACAGRLGAPIFRRSGAAPHATLHLPCH